MRNLQSLRSWLSQPQRALEDINDERCRRNPLLWLRKFTLTENEQHKKENLPYKAPFPGKSYFDVLFQYFASESHLFIPKTRDMMTSWCACGWGAHQAQWHKAETIVQTESEDKAKKLVNYARILYENQPQWLKYRHPLKDEGTQVKLEWADGGKFYGIPKGENKIRMHHPTIYIMDEAAFLPEAQQCYDAAFPVCQQIIAISSAGPGWFGNQCNK